MSENGYLPYKAINIFLEQDFLESVLRKILDEKNNLSKENQIALDRLFRQEISVLGFRDPTRAPLPLRLNAYLTAFEEKDEVIPLTLSIWTQLNLDLAKEVKDWLDSEGWENLAFEHQYNESEGFQKQWPEELTFDKLIEKFKESHPDHEISREEIILLVLWISGQLPTDQSVI